MDLWASPGPGLPGYGYPQDPSRAQRSNLSWKLSLKRAFPSHGFFGFVYSHSRRSYETRVRLLEIGRERKKRKRTYNAKIRAVLEALQASPDVSSALHPWQGNLQPKEQSAILSEQQDWKVAMDLFSWFQSQEDHVPNVFMYNILFRIIGRHKRWDFLNGLWDRMKLDKVCPTNVTYSTIINAYTKAGLIKEAITWFDGMFENNVEPDEVTLNTMVNLYKMAGMYQEAEHFSKHFLLVPEDNITSDQRHPLQIDTYNTLIDLYGKSGHLHDATRTFEEMMFGSVKPNDVTFNTMIHICGMHNRMEEAEGLFKKMVEDGHEPDVDTFNILIAMHVKAGNMQAAKDAFLKLKETRGLPNAVTYRTLFLGYSSRGLVTEVEHLSQEMEEVGFPLNEALMVHLVQMYIEIGDDVKAADHFERLKVRPGLDTSHFVPLIDAYAHRGLWREAERVFVCANEYGLKKYTILYNVMMKAYRLGKVYPKAFSLFESMRDKGVEMDEASYNTMILAASDAGEAGIAAMLLSEMDQEGYKANISSYTALLTAYGRQGLVGKARDIFEAMKKVYSKVDMVAYSAMINAYADAGMLKEAEATVHAMESEGHLANHIVYCSMMKLYGKLDMVEEAEKVFKKIESVQGGSGGVFARNTLLDVYGKAGMSKAAWSCYQKMQDEGLINGVSCNIMMKILMNETGRDEDALLVARKMTEMGLIDDVSSFNNVIGVYASNDMHHEALKVFKQMIEMGFMPDVRTYQRMRDILENPGLLKEALQELDAARKEDNPDSVHRSIAMASLYSVAELPMQALEVCDKVRKSSKAFNNEAACWNALINAHGSNGQFDVAVRLFMEMQARGPKPNTVTFTSMLLLYGKAGLVEGVARLFRKMKQEECTPDDATFKAIINTYKKAGRFDLVSMATHEMKFIRFLKESGGGMLSEGESDVLQKEGGVWE